MFSLCVELKTECSDVAFIAGITKSSLSRTYTSENATCSMESPASYSTSSQWSLLLSNQRLQLRKLCLKCQHVHVILVKVADIL